MIKYSVIIPVYNAEKTLMRCVDSILDQKYNDMELILVNDGSTDHSIDICNAYQKKYPCVQVIDKPNGGVSTARNAGLAVATGEYVLFVDSDDYVASDYFDAMERLTSERQWDMLMFSYAVTDGKYASPKVTDSFHADCIEKSVSLFCQMIYTKTINHPVTKCYIRRIIEDHNIRFPAELYIGEDKIFNMQYMVHCKSCLITPEILYYASLENDQSLSRKIRPDLSQQLLLVSDYTRQIIQNAAIPKSHMEQYHAAENLIQLREVYSEAKRMHLTGCKSSFRRNVIRNMCSENNRQKASLPGGLFSKLLQIPVRLKLVTVIDLMGWYLAR